jgi:ornithine carbamoyltransferase
MRKDLLSIADLSSEDIRLLISGAIDMKAGGWFSLLDRKVLALMFEESSLRIRVSFEVAMRQLGGNTIYLSPTEVSLVEHESIPDTAQVLSRYVNAIAARTLSHHTLEILASHSAVPVINARSDLEHPCQALSDLLTIYEKKGELNGLTLAFIGDGNSVAHSLMLATPLMGMNFRISCPTGYAVQDRLLFMAQDYAKNSGADVVYTDVWPSMGQETGAQQQRQIFAKYQVNSELLSLAKEDALLMHPLPAHHGEEVAEGILDSPKSAVFDQAENRMHLQKALLAQMLGGLEILLGYH